MEPLPPSKNNAITIAWPHLELQLHTNISLDIFPSAASPEKAVLVSVCWHVICCPPGNYGAWCSCFFASIVTDPDVVLTSRYVTFAKQFIDAGFLSSAKDLILVSGVIMLVLIAFKNGIKAIVTYWMARFGVGIEAYFGSKLLNGFLMLPYKWHLTCNSADLINAVN